MRARKGKTMVKASQSHRKDLSQMKTLDSILREIEAGKKLRSMIVNERSVKRLLPHYEENIYEKEQREKAQKERDLLRSKLTNYAKVLRPKYAYRLYNQVDFDNLDNMRENLRRIESEIKANPNVLNNMQVSIVGDSKAKEKVAEQEAELERLREELAKAHQFMKQRDAEFKEVMEKTERELKRAHDHEIEQFRIQLDQWKAEHGRALGDFTLLQEELQNKMKQYTAHIMEREKEITELKHKILQMDEESKQMLAHGSTASQMKMQELVQKIQELQGVIHNQELALAHFRAVAMAYQKEITIVEQAKRVEEEGASARESATVKMMPSPPKTPKTPRGKPESHPAGAAASAEPQEEATAPSPGSVQIAQDLNPIFQKLTAKINKYHFNSHLNRITANAMLFDQYEQLVREKKLPKPAQQKAMIDQITSSVDNQFPDRFGFFKQPLSDRQDQFYKANMLSHITGTELNIPKGQDLVGISDYSWSGLGATEEERKRKMEEMLSNVPETGAFGKGFQLGLHHGLKHIQRHVGNKVHGKLKKMIFRK